VGASRFVPISIVPTVPVQKSRKRVSSIVKQKERDRDIKARQHVHTKEETHMHAHIHTSEKYQYGGETKQLV